MRATRRAGAAVLTTIAALALVPITAPSASAEDTPTPRQLLELCDNGTDTCEFHPAGPSTFTSEPVETVGKTANCSTVTQPGSTITWKSSDIWSNSEGTYLKIAAGAGKVFALTFQFTYNRTVTQSITEEESIAVELPAGHIGYAQLARRREHVTGSYELRFTRPQWGHYIWYVENFTVNLPVKADNGSIATNHHLMTSEERAQNCPA